MLLNAAQIIPSVTWSKRAQKFEAKLHACTNLVCKITYCL